ncbi:MAG: ATP phosphoribosyltransferase regulatory subunit [Pseudomonadota bacterium]
MRNWLLPEFIEDILPAEALRVERLRGQLLELFRVHGYQLVMPPMLEYMESLLTGTGWDMDLATFKLVDQLSGRHMGLRADTTPQVARIDAHLLNKQGVVRLCYAGRVLHTLPAGLTRTREPIQIGAEIYGHAGIESDGEVLQLMMAALDAVGVERIHLDLGHVGIFRALASEAGLTPKREQRIFEALQGKDVPALAELTVDLKPPVRNALLKLPELYGGVSVLQAAKALLPPLPAIASAIGDLQRITDLLGNKVPEISFDLAELTGYHYHTGIVFAGYARGSADAIVRGGRYDGIGSAFGRARPATGFTIIDLRQLGSLLPAPSLPSGILAPLDDDPVLAEEIQALRANGEVVIVDLSGHETQRAELNCDRQLVLQNGKWQVLPF